MSEQSKGFHSIIFKRYESDGTLSTPVNTWDDWHLVPSSRPVVTTPEQKKMTVEIPGVDGELDFSNSISGKPLFNNRKGSWEFKVMTTGDYGQWYERYSQILNYAHGWRFQIILEDDPNWYYDGSVEVGEWVSNNDGSGSTISFNYNVKPYKYSLDGTQKSL